MTGKRQISDEPRASEVLAGAARLLLEKGWCQGTYARRRGKDIWYGDASADSFCVSGAIMRAEGDEDSGDARDLLDIACGEFRVDYNDAPERTRDDVVTAIDAAYILALQEEGVEPEDVL